MWRSLSFSFASSKCFLLWRLFSSLLSHRSYSSVDTNKSERETPWDVWRARILLLLDMGHHHGLSSPELELLGEGFSSSNHPTGQQQLQQSWGREEGGSSTQMMMMHEVIQQKMLSLQSLTTRAWRWQKHWKPICRNLQFLHTSYRLQTWILP